MERPFRTVHGGTVVFGFSPTDDCPCGSGNPAERCCLTPRGFAVKQLSTRTCGTVTGLARSGCYASGLQDCSPRLSREHYISESILEVLHQEAREDFRISGFPWQPQGGKLSVPPNALTAKVLCERHNSSLSGLDSIALRLFRAFDDKDAAHSGRKVLHIFNGHDIERWFLKVLCGLASSGNLPFDRPTKTEVLPHWTEILFGFSEFERGQGLYICREIGERLSGPRGVAVGGIGQVDRLVGISALLCGVEIVLMMEPLQERRLFGRNYLYRPMELYTVGPDFEKSVCFTWEGPADHGTISLELEQTG